MIQENQIFAGNNENKIVKIFYLEILFVKIYTEVLPFFF